MEPDLKKSGYTIGFAKFTPLPTDDPNITNALSALVSSMGIRMKVEPQIVNAGEKNITRTIIVTDPNGNETRTDQVVHFILLVNVLYWVVKLKTSIGMQVPTTVNGINSWLQQLKVTLQLTHQLQQKK